MNAKDAKILRFAAHGNDLIYQALKGVLKELPKDRKKIFIEQIKESNDEYKQNTPKS